MHGKYQRAAMTNTLGNGSQDAYASCLGKRAASTKFKKLFQTKISQAIQLKNYF